MTRDQLERVVFSHIRDDHGDNAMAKEPLISQFTGYNFGDREVPVNYLHAIEGAERLSRIAQGMVDDYARKARGQGRSWAEIADAFGIDRDEVSEPAVAAFERVAPPERWTETNAYWTCTSCEQRVTDRGPYDADPTGNETGHGQDCERHQREISAYVSRFDRSDSDPGWEFER
ncbi:hypothetical protein [Nocardia sp. NPDC057030]|uniref:hypothetical protein n=1 Tax=unclassified Nocardia TaxID=2637762 RepID=UPI003627D7E2